MADAAPTLSIVIPAYNEETAIAGTVERCLQARPHIVENGRVARVEILVVDDGSTDRTEEIARRFDEITVLGFARNRGYGAALKCGFDHAGGDLLGFLDADGTCDPRSFADLCRALVEQQTDIAVGARLGADSRMPLLRAVGNMLFALLLGILSRRPVGDTASGMRVLRASALPDLVPLPDGLHFTPAMSARVLLEGKLRMVEVPVPYDERVGRSKLRVVGDGLRFLRVIVQAATCYHPARPLLIAATAIAAVALLVGIGPTGFYLRRGELEEWMIYRILLASLLATAVAVLVCTAVVSERIAALSHGRPAASQGPTGLASRLFTRRMRRVGGVALLIGAVAVVWPGIAEYVTRGEIEMHWSRAVLGSLLVFLAVTLATTTFLLTLLDLIRERRSSEPALLPPDRVRSARRRPPAAPRSDPSS